MFVVRAKTQKDSEAVVPKLVKEFAGVSNWL